MKLQTQIPLSKQLDNQIDYQSNIVLLGSCFAENIGDKFAYYKFRNCQNPFGIIFNPLSIEKLIVKSINKDYFTENDVFFHNEQWHCYDVHSKLSDVSKERLLSQLNSQIDATHQQLHNASHIIITFGTSWVYKLTETQQLVANCHKVPQKEFSKHLLSIQELSASISKIVECIHTINAKASIIFTVSPVRHIKDGFVENTLSKAHLISAIHQFLNLQSSIVNCQSFYFPSFEILMDELRDYRFYADDMLHPNAIAVNYIWEKFCHVWLHPDTAKTMDAVHVVQTGLLHKPFNSETLSHQAFLKGLEVKKQQLTSQFPHIVF